MKDQELIQKVIKLVSEERRIGVEVLMLLQEIERRKAYSPLGYDGLFSFCVKELRYSEAQAYRRIQAMRAMTELPELKNKIETGVLTVTTVSQVQTHFRQQKKIGAIISKEKKLDLFASIENQSAKEVEKKIEAISGKTQSVVLTLSLDEDMQRSWNEIKNRSAHSTHGDAGIILKLLMREWLNKNTLNKTEKPAIKDESENKILRPVFAKKDISRQNSRYIGVAIKREVATRDQNQCQNCGSNFALQLDHRLPYASGGTNSPENLRLLCRSCNLHQGIKTFGLQKMRRI